MLSSSPSSSFSRRIRALNKEGVKSLQHGRFVDAIYSFRHSLECLKSGYHASPGGEVDETDNALCEATETLRMSLIQSPICLDQSFLHSVTPHNAFDIYSVAFLYTDLDNHADSFYYEVSIIILYNMALAHHLAGLSATTSNSKRHLQEALRYYKMSLTVFQSRKSTFVDDSYSLILGLLNNMGHIFCHSFQIKEAQTCSHHIDLLLASPDANKLSDADGEFFLGTVLHTRSFEEVVAPAA